MLMKYYIKSKKLQKFMFVLYFTGILLKNKVIKFYENIHNKCSRKWIVYFIFNNGNYNIILHTFINKWDVLQAIVLDFFAWVNKQNSDISIIVYSQYFYSGILRLTFSFIQD